MKNLLVGNGINIQFNKTDYTAQQIVLRILKNCDREGFPTHIIVNFPYLLKNYLGQLFLEAREMLEGKYDVYVTCDAEKDSLEAFKKRYAKSLTTLRMTDIGFEDYYLIHDLVCHKTKINNPEQYYAREGMRVAYLYAIYNDGKLNSLYEKYPAGFLRYLMGFDNIFTTNYDSNIDLATGKTVFHIHGSFEEKSDIYQISSLRNQLPDAPIKEIEVDESFYYLYSNALTTYCGAYKVYQLNQRPQANDVLEKMAVAYNKDPKIKQDVDSWTLEDNKLTANMGYAIQQKAVHPELEFIDDYHFAFFKNIEGSLEILGLSPWNDFHIFEAINQSEITECVYHYYNEDECTVVKELLPKLDRNGTLKFSSSKEFWEACYE